MRDYNEYKNEVVTAMGPEYMLKTIQKNNGLMLDGITYSNAEDHTVNPVVYINGFYDQDKTVEEAVAGIKAALEANGNASFDVNAFKSWDRVQEKLSFKLLNKDMNKEILKDIPYKAVRGTDLVKIAIANFKIQGQNGTITIKQEHLAAWGISKVDLFRAAEKNAPKIAPAEIKSLAEMIPFPINDAPMMVLTNVQRTNGAATMFYPKVLRDFAEERELDEILIIPSSIHEVLLITEQTKDVEELANIIAEVNATQLAPQEILGTRPYIYRKETNNIRFA